MAIHTEGPVPYTPSHTVITVINHVRERGVPRTPFTNDVLMRMGISESLAARTLQSLKPLGLIDDEGNPTQQLEDLRRAPQADFQERLAEYVRSTYAHIFEYIVPAEVDFSTVRDHFRGNTPHSQQDRMAKLFLGLCEAAGIVKEAPIRKRSSKSSQPTKSREPSSSNNGTSEPKRSTPRRKTARTPVNEGINPALHHLVNDLPQYADGWTESKRERFLAAFTALLDLWIPILSEEDTQLKQGELDL